MAFETTKREVSELYAFARLLADGSVPMGSVTAEVKSSDNTSVDTPCRRVRRERYIRVFIRCNHENRTTNPLTWALEKSHAPFG